VVEGRSGEREWEVGVVAGESKGNWRGKQELTTCVVGLLSTATELMTRVLDWKGMEWGRSEK
jgi:hypothetical protein